MIDKMKKNDNVKSCDIFYIIYKALL